MRSHPLWLSAFCALAGCGAQPSPWSTPYVHTVVPWVQGPDGSWFLVDTGTPRTQVVPDIAGTDLGEHSLVDFEIAGLAPDPVVVSSALPERLLAAEANGEIQNVGGIVGADVLFDQAVWFEPRGERLYFVEPPPGTELLATLPMEQLGGGSTCLSDGVCYDFEATRLLVDVKVNGEPLTLIVDSAATYVTLQPSVLQRLETQMHNLDFGGQVVPVGGVDMELGGLQVARVAVTVADAVVGEAIVRTGVEAGRTIDGLLGHALLRSFVTGVDAPGQTLELRGYDDEDWDFAPRSVHPGAVVVDSDIAGCWDVRYVIPEGEAAAAGLAPGVCVTRIDDQGPDDQSADAIMDRLHALGPGAATPWEWDGGEAVLSNIDILE